MDRETDNVHKSANTNVMSAENSFKNLFIYCFTFGTFISSLPFSGIFFSIVSFAVYVYFRP
jgi:hypothetical protein